jgi:hypothetical protein
VRFVAVLPLAFLHLDSFVKGLFFWQIQILLDVLIFFSLNFKSQISQSMSQAMGKKGKNHTNFKFYIINEILSSKIKLEN